RATVSLLLLRGLGGQAGRSQRQRAQVHPRPGAAPAHGVSSLGSLGFLCFLLPRGWAPAHLESYRKQEGWALASLAP
uniref:Uncharacterized protein n=1 Tax=Bos mutus grunniens TaxID=30521 RepID=A0A8B9XYG3_BOSMU